MNVHLTWWMMVKAGCCCCWLTSDVVLSFIVASVITDAARVLFLSSRVANYTLLQQLKQRYLTTTASQWRLDYFLHSQQPLACPQLNASV